jgi:hypothetical protein
MPVFDGTKKSSRKFTQKKKSPRKNPLSKKEKVTTKLSQLKNPKYKLRVKEEEV